MPPADELTVLIGWWFAGFELAVIVVWLVLRRLGWLR